MKKINKKIKQLNLEFQTNNSVNNSRCPKSWTKESSSVKLKKSDSNISQSNRDMLFDNLITIEELADYIGVSQKTIRNWVAMRSIPFLRIGRKTFFCFEKLDKWFQTKEFEPCL
ncbi:MAG: helix-turn-helix domain-containing protein [Oligoflexia bacterium]|nr:helix-turn-helix domain-containing protein [Oligoflexia bacterium]